MDEFAIRTVRVDDWPAVREFRLAALRDPMAPLAFAETFEQARAEPDQFWKDRTAGVSEGGPHRQFVAESPMGEWLGSVTMLIEEPGTTDYNGEPVHTRQAHVVAVFVRAEHRGTTVTPALFQAALDWGRAQDGVIRIRLFVHRDNHRAEACYRKLGFARTRPLGDEHEMEHHDLTR